jgi:serine-type D-Ala-D-Ala endopeptidase (penicillin-binding protein 7)
MIRASLLVCTVLLLFAAPASASRKRHHDVDPPVSTYTRAGLPNVQAQSAAVVDLDGNEELFAKNADAVRPIASISKLMALVVVLEHNLDLDGVTTITDSDRLIASGGARSRLNVGQSFTNRDLLHAALMASDNRAVPALGRAVGLNPREMVVAMNAKAQELNLKHTTFEDPVGLNSNNRSTARDLVGLLRAAMKVPLITEVTEKARYVAHPVGRPNWTIEYNNTDVLARSGRMQVITGKTGYTDLALYCFAVAVRMAKACAEGAVNCDGQRPVAMVFLGAVGKMTRFADVGRVAQWLNERKWRVAATTTTPAAAAKGRP